MKDANRRRATLTAALLLAGASALLLSGCKKKGEWLIGKWLLVHEGKPSACHQFKKDRTFVVFRGPQCKGTPDALLGGKWKMKTTKKLLLQRGKEEGARAAHIGKKDEQKFASTGNLLGTMFRVGAKGSQALIDALTRKGVITMRDLGDKLGCAALRVSVANIRKYAKEKKARMLRSRDQSLEFFANTKTGDPLVKKIVYGVNQDQLDWLYVELSDAAFAAPGPGGRLAATLGKPAGEASTGKGNKRQQISMWKASCSKIGGAALKEVDVTLFSTAGEKRAYYYVSTNVVSQTWSDIKAAANDPSQQADDDGDGDGSGSGSGSAASKKATPPPKKKAAPPKKKKKAAAPAKSAAPAKKATAPSAPKKGRATKGGGIAVPGKANEI